MRLGLDDTMEAPGKNYIGSPRVLTVNFRDVSGNDYDPEVVTLRIMDPWGVETSYVYGTDDEVTRTDSGNYVGTIRPDSAGRWFRRWEAETDDVTEIVSEGDFLVQDSAFFRRWPLWDYWA